MMDRLVSFKEKVKEKAERLDEQVSLLERNLWRCKRCDHALDVNKFYFDQNGNLHTTCKYCENAKTK